MPEKRSNIFGEDDKNDDVRDGEDASKAEPGWLTLDEITAAVSEPTVYNGTKTPLHPPPPHVLDASRRSLSDEPPGLPIVVTEKDSPSTGLPDPHEAARLEDLLAKYLAETRKTAAVAVSGIREKKGNSLENDVLELLTIAHGNNGAVDRVDFQASFRKLTETYGAKNLGTYLISFLRLAHILTIPHLANDGEHWQVSAKATLEMPSPNSPPRVLLFKVDCTVYGQKIRHQYVDLVYILQGLPLATSQ
ncbi:hypothetical protein IT413_05620 [Candidatus Peregrinibacteria bacterium]|nr:hypothetical protein [Candidatus Peregrinibacteria bacterium]